jgi:Uma2 family endonuclease
MSAATLVSIEEYLRMTDKPNREYRDGVLYPKPMPTWLHGILQSVLCEMLRKQGLYTGSEVSLRMSSSKVLVPDVIGARTLELPYPTEPVLLCCEILSPEDRLGAMLAKCEEYHAWGVPFCWVIDPVKRAAWEYHAAGEPNRATGELRAGEIVISLEELFAALTSAPQ